MADVQTTSSKSKQNEYSPSNTKDDEIKCNMKTTSMIIDDTARTLLKGNDKEQTASIIPIQTNLQRLIQNKLKRKKKLNISPTSVDDTTNKKRKTKLDTQQAPSLNNTVNNGSSTLKTKEDTKNNNNCSLTNNNDKGKSMENEKRVLCKPPLPPKSEKNAAVQKAPPPRLKRKLEEQNTVLVQKLNAHAEQLRLEISELKVALANEKGAVRSMRAQYEADSRKSKVETKKLQNALDVTKKAASTVVSVQRKIKEETVLAKESGPDITKFTQEISTLKDANRLLEEKLQMFNEAERRKTSDIRELKDSYEIRLTQITKSAKTEINRLLEEIKTKERNIGQLRKEIHSLKNVTNRKETRNAQHPPEMKKLKDIERTDGNKTSSNQKCNATTCGENEFNSMPHEITERIMEAHDDSHDDLHIFRNKDPISSDSDSALSSAPPSISPQPPSGADSPDIWHSVKNYSKELSNLQTENESLLRENESIKKELELAKQQIEELEKTVLEARDNHPKMQQLQERIQYLEQKENQSLQEIHELREQNELLEFRILELEESHEKWSLSNSTPDTRDMWTDTEKESDDLLIYADRSDSGVTSPQCHHHMDDRNIISPYDLSMLDQVSNDEIKRRITAMTKRTNFDEDDKLCLLQVLSLLNNLEALSQDSVIASEEMMSIDLVRNKSSDYSSSSSPRSFLSETPSFQKSRSGRIVATVLPYSSALSTPTDSPRKLRSWNSSSLQESGVFEGDSNDSYSQCTQTELEDFPCQDGITTGDLCAEIQKLNKFREKIEECVTKSSVKSGVPVILSPNLSEQRRLQYYKERLELLENKVQVYESSGDQQIKRLAERLQREIQLEALAKELQQSVEYLRSDNMRLEEEKCEFEEAENDTRLRLQRLEVDLEILSQRNIELEMSREASQLKLKESRAQCSNYQDAIYKNEKRIQLLESIENDLQNKMNLITSSMPAILLYNALIVHGLMNDCVPDHDPNKALVVKECPCHTDCHEQLNHFMSKEKELSQSLTEMKRAYNETLENADNLWAQMEKDYKDRLTTAKSTETCMKAKILQLEQRLTCDSQCAQERISQLEESEINLKQRLCKMNKDNKDLVAEHEVFLVEYKTLKDKQYDLQKYLEGPAHESLEREKQKVRSLSEDLALANKLMSDTEDTHKGEVHILRSQLAKVNKELLHIEVTNSELKEEVYTLETQISELQRQRLADDDKIRNLTDEIRTKEELLSSIKPVSFPGPSLAQELGPVKRVNVDEISNLTSASEKLAEAIANAEDCGRCSPKSEEIRIMAKEVKSLTDVIISHKCGKKMKPSDEICVDGCLKCRFCSPSRNTAVVYGVNVSYKHLVILQAVPTFDISIAYIL